MFAERAARGLGRDNFWCCDGNQRATRGIWTAFDGAISADRQTLRCRQRVFRCPENITEPGWHDWERNGVASSGVMAKNPEWQGTVWAETRVP